MCSPAKYQGKQPHAQFIHFSFYITESEKWQRLSHDDHDDNDNDDDDYLFIF